MANRLARITQAQRVAILALATLGMNGSAHADSTFTVDSSYAWLGYMNVFETPANGGTYLWGKPWGTQDLCAVFNGANLTLSPNTIDDPNSYWYTPGGGPGAVGNKTMDANMYVEKTNELNGQNVTFQGTVLSNTMASTHPSFAFIKDFAADYSSFNITTVSLNAGPFSITMATDADPARHVQFGFETIGPDVWITDVGTFGNVVLTSSGTPSPQWANTSGGDWFTNSNWTNSAAPNAADAAANFLGNLSAAVGTVTLDAAATVGSMKFANTNSYMISGSGTLTVDVTTGSGSVAVTSGLHQISTAVSVLDNTSVDVAAGSALTLTGSLSAGGVTLTKLGAGSLNINGPVSNASAATLAVNAGFARVGSDLGVNTNVALAGGTLDFKATQHLASLAVNNAAVNIGPESTVLVSTKSLAITGTGKIDVFRGKMAVDYTGGSVLTDVKSAIASGSLTTSASLLGRVLAYGEASDLFNTPTGSFGGSTVDSSTVVVAYTVNGDVNLDGTVDSADFGKLVSTYGSAADRWTQADLNGDGKVSTLDFNLLAGNFGATLPVGAPLGAVVPEPMSLSMIAIGLAFCGRKRRN